MDVGLATTADTLCNIGTFFTQTDTCNLGPQTSQWFASKGVDTNSGPGQVGTLAGGLLVPGLGEEGTVVDLTKTSGQTLFHYTNEAGQQGILQSQELLPSLKAANPQDAKFGDGQYLSDIAPGTRTNAQLSRNFIGQPFQGARFSNFIEIDVSGLDVVRGRENVFVILNDGPLDVTGRIVSWGVNQ